MDTMFQYIRETPAQCRINLDDSKALTQTAVNAYLKKDWQRIEIIACGSSYNATMTAKYFIEKVLHKKVEVVTSLTAADYETVFDEKTFYCGIGQSGRSVNTNSAMHKVLDQGFDVLGITGNVNSVMKDNCSSIVYWGVGVEKIGYVTKGYSTCVFFWMLFAIEAGMAGHAISQPEYEEYRVKLAAMIDAMNAAIDKADSWYQANEEELYSGLSRAQMLGCGYNYGTALEAALKVEETMGKASTAYELEEFLHGPYIETNDTRSVFIFDGGGVSSRRALQIYENIHKLTPHVFMITNHPVADRRVLVLDHSLEEAYTPLVNIIAMQTAAAYGNQKWVNPLQDTRLAFIDSLDYKSPKKGNEIGL